MRDALERVTNLLTLLLESRTALTLQQIADELGDFYTGRDDAVRAAFERDKAMLRDLGVPIETEVLGGSDSGRTAYRIDRDRYELRGLDLDEDERHALQVAVAAARSEVGQEGVWKLGGAVGTSAPVRAELPASPALPVLRIAANRHRAVELRYHGTRRRLDPYGLLLRDGFWYVIGWDHSHGEQRTFRVDRIEGDVAVIEDATFERPAGFDARTAFPDDPKALGDRGEHALVRIDAHLAASVTREVGESAVAARLEGGSVEIEVPCSNLDAFRSWLIGLGTHAEVVAPPEVRADVIAWLETIATRVSA